MNNFSDQICLLNPNHYFKSSFITPAFESPGMERRRYLHSPISPCNELEVSAAGTELLGGREHARENCIILLHITPLICGFCILHLAPPKSPHAHFRPTQWQVG